MASGRPPKDAFTKDVGDDNCPQQDPISRGTGNLKILACSLIFLALLATASFAEATFLLRMKDLIDEKLPRKSWTLARPRRFGPKLSVWGRLSQQGGPPPKHVCGNQGLQIPSAVCHRLSSSIASRACGHGEDSGEVMKYEQLKEFGIAMMGRAAYDCTFAGQNPFVHAMAGDSGGKWSGAEPTRLTWRTPPPAPRNEIGPPPKRRAGTFLQEPIWRRPEQSPPEVSHAEERRQGSWRF